MSVINRRTGKFIFLNGLIVIIFRFIIISLHMETLRKAVVDDWAIVNELLRFFELFTCFLDLVVLEPCTSEPQARLE